MIFMKIGPEPMYLHGGDSPLNLLLTDRGLANVRQRLALLPEGDPRRLRLEWLVNRSTNHQARDIGANDFKRRLSNLRSEANQPAESTQKVKQPKPTRGVERARQRLALLPKDDPRRSALEWRVNRSANHKPKERVEKFKPDYEITRSEYLEKLFTDPKWARDVFTRFYETLADFYTKEIDTIYTVDDQKK